jgi:signal transduction histidine kinase
MAQQVDLPEVPADPHPRPPRWLPDVVVSVIVVVSTLLPSPVPEFLPTGPVSTVLLLLPIVVLPWRRRWPLTVLVLLLVLFGAASATGTLSPGIAIAIGVAMFRVAVQSTRRRAFLIGGFAAVAIMLLTLPASIGTIWDPRVFQFGLIVAFATAAGDGARSRHAYIAAINDRAERAVQTREAEARRRVSEERLRIARDLHDAVAHQIAVISLHAGVASSTVDTRPEKAKDSLATIRAAARTVLGEIGDLMTMLRTNDDDAARAAPRPQAGMDRLDELVEQFRASGLDVHTRIEGDPSRVTGAVSLVGYRVVQEALTNAHKHGIEHRAHILFRIGTDTTTVTVTNPTDTGATAEPMTAGTRLGLLGLRERVASVRGTLAAGLTSAGWKVEACLPLAEEAAA